MQYSVATFRYRFREQWQQELFLQRLADIGFDSFEEDKAYVPTSQLDESALHRLVRETEGVEIVGVSECPDENWNAVWEAEHGEWEIAIGGEEDRALMHDDEADVHDGTVVIVPHCAFGAGYHETTSMLTGEMIRRGARWMHGRHVLDNGSGTGVLGIVAARLGAAQVVAVDIDEKSVESTRLNAERNDVTVDARLGKVPPEGEYDLILSNIHRNILMEQMPLYARYLRQGGEVWLSGFYEDDCAQLVAAAEQAGLQPVARQENGEWRMLIMTR